MHLFIYFQLFYLAGHCWKQYIEKMIMQEWYLGHSRVGIAGSLEPNMALDTQGSVIAVASASWAKSSLTLSSHI